MANRMVGYGLFTETAIPDQGLGKMYFEIGEEGVLWTYIEKARYEKVPVILVGNKVDLESEREVSLSEGRALAEEWGCPFMETSAKSKTMVDELFAEIVRQMNYAAQPDKDDPCCSACNIQ
ncbi:ras-related protein Rap-2a [Cyanistes caeruleus]|uniref:ras-related protein Rap-2a n=1 Tax=Cyanistes caeruleus TaxID=156563 RepID=UPI000CDA4387|nr:ras-related protein Rap-2a [Cyanistes caeruleus]